jgi:MFS superfamily sulfate permease-like transporter
MDEELKFKRFSLVIGAILLVVLIGFHTLVQPIPVWILAIPGFLMGLDPRDFFRK